MIETPVLMHANFRPTPEPLADPDGRNHDRVAIDHTCAFGGSLAAKNDGYWNAYVHALCIMVGACRAIGLLARGKYCRLHPTVLNKSLDTNCG